MSKILTGFASGFDAGYDVGFGIMPTLFDVWKPTYYNTLAQDYADRYLFAVASDFAEEAGSLGFPTFFHFGGKRLEHYGG